MIQIQRQTRKFEVMPEKNRNLSVAANFDCRKKVKASQYEVPEHMNPTVRLRNIWDELSDGGKATDLLPSENNEKAVKIRYDTKVISLFGDNSS